MFWLSSLGLVWGEQLSTANKCTWIKLIKERNRKERVFENLFPHKLKWCETRLTLGIFLLWQVGNIAKFRCIPSLPDCRSREMNSWKAEKYATVYAAANSILLSTKWNKTLKGLRYKSHPCLYAFISHIHTMYIIYSHVFSTSVLYYLIIMSDCTHSIWQVQRL